MQLTEMFLLGSISIMVAISILDKDKTKFKVLSNKITLSRAYYESIAFLWLPVTFLIIHLNNSPLSLSSIGLTWSDQWQSITSASLLAIIIVYFIYTIFTFSKDLTAQKKFANEMESMAWFMPKDNKQLTIFTVGLSVSAGVCEELIFRGYLLNILTEHIGLSLAVIISSALFGICHLYQGVFHVVRTFVIGLIFCAVYLFSETLIIPIILHIAIDVYGGVLSYIARNYNQEQDSALTY